jgi:hypothetical protein
MKNILPELFSKRLALLAFVLWLGSLCLVSMVLYRNNFRPLIGLHFLLNGWLAPIFSNNYAWFANPLFLWAIFRLKIDKSADVIGLMALLVALNTFTFSEYLYNANGSATPVYAYGWGVVLWLASLCMLVAAAGMHQLENSAEYEIALKLWGGFLFSVGFLLLFFTFVLSIYWAVQDRLRSNDTERLHLSGLAFKRGPVCGVKELIVTRKLTAIYGALEVNTPDTQVNAPRPFQDPINLLKWGIPVIRMANRDYSYVVTDQERLLVSLPASAPAAATLLAKESIVENKRQIELKLYESVGQQAFFEYKWWEVLKNSGYYCPDYTDFPNGQQQPQKAILEALGLPIPSPREKQEYAGRASARYRNHVEAVVLSNTAASGSFEQSGQTSSRNNPVPDAAATAKRELMEESGTCAGDIGWASQKSIQSGFSPPFMVGTKAFYLESNAGDYNALCANGHVYLYSGHEAQGKYYLDLEKRTLPEFRWKWSQSIVIYKLSIANRNDALELSRLNEDINGVITLNLVNEKTGQSAVIQALIKLPH